MRSDRRKREGENDNTNDFTYVSEDQLGMLVHTI